MKITKEQLLEALYGYYNATPTIRHSFYVYEAAMALEKNRLSIEGYTRGGSKKPARWRKFNVKDKRTFPRNEKGNFLVASEVCQTNAIGFKKDVWERSGVLWWLELPELPPLPKIK